jgi:cytochrome c553
MEKRRNMRFFYISLALIAFLSGCGEKKSKEEVKKAEVSEIKITQNVVKEQKVKEKKVDKGEFYYSYNKKSEPEEKSGEIVEDEAKYTKLGAYRYVKNYEAVQISLLANKLSKDFLIYCSACHDDYANGIIGPSLLGKSEDFIYKQLQDFKNGKRKNVLMVQLVRRLSDEKLKALANEVAEFNKKVQKIKEQNKIKG